jgi:hypothetical protein
MATRRSVHDASIDSLIFARRLLLAAALVQLPYVLPIVFKISIAGGGRALFGFMLVSSGILAVLGHITVKRIVNREGLEDPSIQVRFSISIWLAAHVLFWLCFFVPLGNLVLVLWASSRARSGIQTLETRRSEDFANQERMGKLRGGVCDAFRNAP